MTGGPSARPIRDVRMMRHFFVQLSAAKNRTEGRHFSTRPKCHPLRAKSNWQVGFHVRSKVDVLWNGNGACDAVKISEEVGGSGGGGSTE